MIGQTPSSPAIRTLVVPRSSVLGDGLRVLRALPSRDCRMAGPFVFFDQMGPVTLAPGKGLGVRPHPHIGLATVTYLFSGEILHRDSLGLAQPIRPAEVNWMTAAAASCIRSARRQNCVRSSRRDFAFHSSRSFRRRQTKEWVPAGAVTTM